MKASSLLLILLLATKLVLAQSSNLEELHLPELKGRLAASKNDTDRVQLQLAIGRVIVDKSDSRKEQLDSAFFLARQAEALSRKVAYHPGIINAMILSALCWNKKGDAERGFRTAQQTLAYAVKVNNGFGIGESYVVMGHHYNVDTMDGLEKRMAYNEKAIAIFRKERILLRLASLLKDNAELLLLAQRKVEAVKLLFEALEIGRSIGYKRVHSTYWLICRTSEEMSDFPNAMKYGLLAIRTAKEVNDTTLQLCSIYHTMAMTYSSMNDYGRAIPYSLLALQVARNYHNKDYISTVAMVLATAYTHTNRLDKAMELLGEVKKYSQHDVARLAAGNNLLTNLTYAGKMQLAGRYAMEVRSLLNHISANNYGVFRASYAALAQYYLKSRQYGNARYYNDRYAEIVHKINYAAGIRMTEKGYYVLDSVNGDFRSAMDHYLIAQRIKDSIDNITKAYQVSLLQIENETEQKNSHIDTLTKQAQVKDGLLKRTRFIQNTIVAVSALLLIITGLVYSRYRLKQRTNRKLEANQRELDQKNMFLETLNTEQEKLLREKEWLLREVHHRVKNSLQMVTSLLYSQSVYLEDDAAVLAIKDSLRRMQAMSLIHQKLYQDENTSTLLMSEYINELVQYLHDSFDADNRIVFEQAVAPLDLDVSQAIPLGLILTESIVNAIKYAFLNGEQGTVHIHLQHDGPDHLLLRISDNGVGLPGGFDMAGSNSLGLDLMQGLAKQLKGSFEIEDSNGVHIRVRFAIFKNTGV